MTSRHSPFPSRYSPVGSRQFSLSPNVLGAVKSYGFIVNILAGAYIGGLLVCGGTLYLLYNDAKSRQPIPFEISWQDQITAAKAINKDDVLKSPRYAVKHYRRLLIDLAKHQDPTVEEPIDAYDVPLIPSSVLMGKSPSFANFYIDIVLRYARALLAKGQLDTSVNLLQKIINDDEIFYNVGDAERLSQCCRLLSKVSGDKIGYLQRAIHMLTSNFPSLRISDDYLLQSDSKLTDEALKCLNDLAFNLAKEGEKKNSTGKKGYFSAFSGFFRGNKEKSDDLNELSGLSGSDCLSLSLNIYLANLKSLTTIREKLDNGDPVQAQYPLFNCDETNLVMLMAEIKAHISEIMWAKGFKKNAVAWSEDVLEEIYFAHANSRRASPILINILSNLGKMYDNLHDLTSKKRCDQLMKQLDVFELDEQAWYDTFVARLSKIIYDKGPLGIIEKPLTERFGRVTRVKEIEEVEDEDED